MSCAIQQVCQTNCVFSEEPFLAPYVTHSFLVCDISKLGHFCTSPCNGKVNLRLQSFPFPDRWSLIGGEFSSSSYLTIPVGMHKLHVCKKKKKFSPFFHQEIDQVIIRAKVICKYLSPLSNGENYHPHEILCSQNSCCWLCQTSLYLFILSFVYKNPD